MIQKEEQKICKPIVSSIPNHPDLLLWTAGLEEARANGDVKPSMGCASWFDGPIAGDSSYRWYLD